MKRHLTAAVFIPLFLAIVLLGPAWALAALVALGAALAVLEMARMAQRCGLKVQRPTAVALALGRADRALDLAQDDRAQSLLDWAMRIDDAVTAGRPAAILDMAEEVARSSDRDLVLETLSLFYRDVAAAALDSEGTLVFAHRVDSIRQRAAVLNARQAADRFAAIQVAFASLERNANPEVTLDALFFGLSQ